MVAFPDLKRADSCEAGCLEEHDFDVVLVEAAAASARQLVLESTELVA
jgi:hypothetical protein